MAVERQEEAHRVRREHPHLPRRISAESFKAFSFNREHPAAAAKSLISKKENYFLRASGGRRATGSRGLLLVYGTTRNDSERLESFRAIMISTIKHSAQHSAVELREQQLAAAKIVVIIKR